jgi:hypothetical protein
MSGLVLARCAHIQHRHLPKPGQQFTHLDLVAHGRKDTRPRKAKKEADESASSNKRPDKYEKTLFLFAIVFLKQITGEMPPLAGDGRECRGIVYEGRGIFDRRPA